MEFVLKNPCQQLCIFSAVSLPHKGSRPKLFPKFPVRPRCMLARSQQISPKAICTVSCPSALHARSFQPSSPQAISNSFLPTELCPSNCREIHYRLARAIMHLNYIAGFLPFFEPTVDWDDADTHRRSQPYPFPVTHNTHSGRNLHAFVPLPSSPAHPTLVSHGGLPSHMIVNPALHFRPASSWPQTVVIPLMLSVRDPAEGNHPIQCTYHSVLLQSVHQLIWAQRTSHRTQNLDPRRSNEFMSQSLDYDHGLTSLTTS